MSSESPSLNDPQNDLLVDVDGLEIRCHTSASIADRDRPLVVCLHGFPDTAHSWRHLLPALDAAGFRAAAPFLRGYAPSGVPADGRFQSGAAALDAIAVHEHLGGDARAVVIGHDWGAPIAYGAASFEPDRWSHVVGMAVPPGAAMGQALVTNLDQLQRSWYMFLFQSPFTELVLPMENYAFIDRLWSQWSPGYDAGTDLPAVKDAIRDPANLAAVLGIYRAALGDGFVDPALEAVQQATQAVPEQSTLYLHGGGDGCIGAEVAESARALVGPNVTIEIVDGLGHFLHLEDPHAINTRILEFLS